MGKLALAVGKLALAVGKPTSFLAQRLFTYGSSLCKDDTRGIRFSEHELAFFSLLSKVSRSALQFLQGPMNAQTADVSMSAAFLMTLCPAGKHFKTMMQALP